MSYTTVGFVFLHANRKIFSSWRFSSEYVWLNLYLLRILDVNFSAYMLKATIFGFYFNFNRVQQNKLTRILQPWTVTCYGWVYGYSNARLCAKLLGKKRQRIVRFHNQLSSKKCVCLKANDPQQFFLAHIPLPVLVLFRTGCLENSCRRWKERLCLYTERNWGFWMWIKVVKSRLLCEVLCKFCNMNLTLTKTCFMVHQV